MDGWMDGYDDEQGMMGAGGGESKVENGRGGG